MELMANFAIDIARVEKEHGIDFKAYFADALEALQEFVDADLVEISDEKITVSPTGTLLIRNIAMPFDVCEGTRSHTCIQPVGCCTLTAPIKYKNEEEI